MPVGVLLIRARRLDHGEIVSCAPHELQPYREILLGKTAGHRESRQAAEVADGTQRIRKRKIRFQVHLQRRGCNGLCCCHQHVEQIKQIGHLLLQNFPHTQSLQIIGSGILLVDVPGDLSERVGQFTHLAGTYQRPKRRGAFHRDNDIARIFEGSFGKRGVLHTRRKLAQHLLRRLDWFCDARLQLFPRIGQPANFLRPGFQLH